MEDKFIEMKNIVDVIGVIIKELEVEELQCVIGMVVDEYGARHGMSAEETMGILEEVCEVQKSVFASCGSADYVREV